MWPNWALGRVIRREKFAPETHAAIGAAVRATLRFNLRVRLAETLVQVLDGVVTLAGTVSNLRTRHDAEQDAEQDARYVVGVANVHNLLKVRPAQRVPDEYLRQNIAAVLTRNPYVGHLVFGVQVHGGQALLTGQANTHFELEQAGEVASGVSGVVDVNNRLDMVGVAAAAGPQSALRNPDLCLAVRIRDCYCWSATLHNQMISS